jgi:Flp pilus assembly protein TadD
MRPGIVATAILRSGLAIALCQAALLAIPAAAADGLTREAAGSTRSLYLLLIRQARADGRPRAALAYLADFDRQHPGDFDARVLRINCLLDLGQTEAAVAALAQLPAGGADGEVHAVRGHVLAAQGGWSPAIVEYQAALGASPADPLIRNALGYAQLRAGLLPEAIETLRAAADLAPENTVIRNNLLLALTLAGRAGEAEAAIRAMPDAGARAALRSQLGEQADRLAVTTVGGR